MSHHCSRGRSGRMKWAVDRRGFPLILGSCVSVLLRDFRREDVTIDFRGVVLFGRSGLLELGFVMTVVLIRIGSYVLRITGCVGWSNGKHVAEGEGLVVSSQRYEFWPSLFYLGKRIPFIRWLTNNTVFSNDSVMMRFLNYVMRMSSIDNSTLAILGISRIMNGFLEGIKKTDGLKDFENFLNAMGIESSLVLKELPDNQYALYFSHDKLVPFETASSGTKAATQLYRRLVSGGFGNAQSPSFVYMDEFDAYYHYEMSQNVIEYLKKNYPQTQIVFTTHNTVLMSNRIMRPDCLFLLSTKGNLTPLQKATERELREGHNLAKMYMSGEFEQYE